MRIQCLPMVIFSNSDSVKTVFPCGPYSNGVDWEMVREMLETLNMPANNDMEVEVGFQTCNTPNAPDAPVALATLRSSDGLSFPGAFVDKTASTGNKQLVRPVYLAKNKAGGGSTVRWCWASGAIEIKKK